MKLHVVFLASVVLLGMLIFLPSENIVNKARYLKGGQGGLCWTTTIYPCGLTTYTCSQVACTPAGNQSFVCPNGTFEQQAFSHYFGCARASSGYNECLLIMKPSLNQVCAIRRSCSNPCAVAVAGPNFGQYFCGSAVGQTWNINMPPFPFLGDGNCPWYRDPSLA